MDTTSLVDKGSFCTSKAVWDRSFAAKVEGMPLKTTSFHSQHVGSTSHCRRFSDQVSPRMNHPTNQSLCKLMKISLLHLLAKSLPLLLLRFEVGP